MVVRAAEVGSTGWAARSAEIGSTGWAAGSAPVPGWSSAIGRWSTLIAAGSAEVGSAGWRTALRAAVGWATAIWRRAVAILRGTVLRAIARAALHHRWTLTRRGIGDARAQADAGRAECSAYRRARDELIEIHNQAFHVERRPNPNARLGRHCKSELCRRFESDTGPHSEIALARNLPRP
jgi:hypothetical protein